MRSLETNKLLDLYRRLTRLRQVEQFIAQKYEEYNIRCPVHLCIGQEAVSVGLASALGIKDMLFGTHRSHGPYVASGGPLMSFFAELLGRTDGCCCGRGGSMHLTASECGFWGAVPIVGSTIPIATGAGLALQMQGKKQVSAVLFGDAATEEGVFHESIQFASLKKLPVVYVCENNGLSVNTPLSQRRPAGMSLTGLAAAHGLYTASGDGNDAVFVYKTCRAARERAVTGHGPAFLEFFTYRWMEHCGPNDDHHLPGRHQEEFESWKLRCPLLNMRRCLADIGISKSRLDDMDKEEELIIAAAWDKASSSPFPESRLAATGVYADDVRGIP